MAKANVSESEIWNCLKKVNLYEFVKERGGLNEVINEESSNISGGEKQRLALAISLVANKNIYIFDEATSNIDVESEEIILNNIKELAKEKTVIFISHRLKKCYIFECYLLYGKWWNKRSKKLIQDNKSYANLYNTQKSLEEGFMEV